MTDNSIAKSSSVVKKEMVLEGLDCVSCASKIELKVNELDEVVLATVNFITKTLTIEMSNPEKTEEVLIKIKEIINKLEPHVLVREKASKRDASNNKSDFKEENNNKELIRLAIGVVFFAAALVLKLSFWAEFILYFISYLLVGGKVVIQAIRNIIKGEVFDENFLMSIATIGAFAIGQFPEGVAVMLFYQVGELLQDSAVNRSRKSITALMNIKPEFATLKVDDFEKVVSPYEVEIGDIIIVKPGEKVPLDGIILQGKSTVDTSALTGESHPRAVNPGNDILSGFVNISGLLTIEVTKVFGESTVSKILELVENASSKKAPTENFITKFAHYYTPAVVFVALLVAVMPPMLIAEATFPEWIYRALIFLVISCPCALVISIPLGFFGGIGGASKHGILIKGANYLEALNNVDVVVFDKTGTLTKGVFKVTEINPKSPIKTDELLKYAAIAEAYSNHPIALSIISAYEVNIDKNAIDHYEEIPGHGIKVVVGDKEIFAGNARLMDKENITYDDAEIIGTVVHVAVNKSYAGYIVISDEIKEDAKSAIADLKRIGIKRIVMLTGDSKYAGEKVAKELHIDEIYSELLPHHKVEKFEMLQQEMTKGSKIAFVGDGINDAPVLARADVGIAMGGLGSDAAIEAADVVIMTDEPSKIASAIKIAKRTRKIVLQNIIFAISIKIIVLILGAGGLATMWEAVFADVGVTLIAVLNSMRVINVKNI